MDPKKIEKLEEKTEKAVETAADELKIAMPKNSTLFGIRLITFFSLLTGIALISSVLAESFNFGDITIPVYFARFFVGLLLIVIAYALFKKLLIGIWLLGLALFMSLLSNVFLTVLPLVAFLYIYHHRKLFHPKWTFYIGKNKIVI